MNQMSYLMFIAGMVASICAVGLYIAYSVIRQTVRVANLATSAGAVRRQMVTTRAPSEGIGKSASLFAIFTLAFLTLSLIARSISTGHGPFANMYEFSVSFAWGIIAAYVYIEVRYRIRVLGIVVVPWAMLLLIYANFFTPRETQPLVPALQNNLLLTVHVAVAIIAYGTFAVGFGAAILYLWQRNSPTTFLPKADVLDEVGYRAVTIGFPMMALVIILGALWADVAWGSYWSWDPKETASLVTLLIYGGYLHARVMRGWRGTRSAILLMIGFAATLFTFFGNLFFSGLHAYSGV